ncbi:hypothetical protein MFRU_043g00370 [Monilinia fructicola]|uniref:Inhibitor of apoptosis repeat-containing protein n=1 Tax=Monilinia fructicola TaxID=38448 RepID=A0A5M9J7T0_MONFR|nr:hypothetical protein EYC84_011267 [Monilinia fructicola]KAG4026233.1 hypothetical protein MFRU_043g00370 [Monilinia fructicola]
MAVRDVAPGYITLETRVASYRSAQPITGRRTSTAGSKAPKNLKWPHKFLLPEQLAKAGFFYYPSQASPDNCACFLCHRSIDSWEEGDDPLVEHLKHSPNCGWAIVASIEAQDKDLCLEYPASVKMVEARTATFAGRWPHEAKRGWKCKTKQLVNAGWKYTPTSESNDMATCTYCSLALDGWEPSDKPLDEHYNRSPNCPFFTLIDEYNSELALKKSTSKKGRPSKASRLSTQSVVAVASDGNTEEGDSILSTATTSGKTYGAKGRKTKANKIESSRLSTQSAITVASNATAEEGDSIISTATTKGKTSALKGRKLKSKNVAPIELPPTVAAASTSRGRKRKSGDEISQPDLPNPEPKRRTTRSSTARVIPQASAAPLRAPTFTDLQNQAGASDLLWMEGSPPRSISPESTPPLSPPQSSVADNQISDTEHQSSDAENHLPEKPNTPQNQHFKTPKSTKQWEAIDVEMFFGDEEHENFVAAMSKLKTGILSKAESQMSVEQWIYHTAEVAQEKLREECERMVASFEAEGLKALACLESIEVV